jgi:hypothetical protein
VLLLCVNYGVVLELEVGGLSVQLLVDVLERVELDGRSYFRNRMP